MVDVAVLVGEEPNSLCRSSLRVASYPAPGHRMYLVTFRVGAKTRMQRETYVVPGDMLRTYVPAWDHRSDGNGMHCEASVVP